MCKNKRLQIFLSKERKSEKYYWNKRCINDTIKIDIGPITYFADEYFVQLKNKAMGRLHYVLSIV